MFAVALGPRAAGTAGAVGLQPTGLVERSGLPIDPTPAQRLVQGLRVGNGRRAAALLEEAHADPGGLGVVPLQPGSPGGGVRKWLAVAKVWSELFVLPRDLGAGPHVDLLR